MFYGKSAFVVFVYNFCRLRHKPLENTASRLPYIFNIDAAANFQARLAIKARRFRGLVYKYKPWKERRIKRKARLKIEFSRGSSRLSTKTTLFSMISVEGDFVRTWWYGRRRIRHKARKYRRFGGVRIILGWHT